MTSRGNFLWSILRASCSFSFFLETLFSPNTLSMKRNRLGWLTPFYSRMLKTDFLVMWCKIRTLFFASYGARIRVIIDLLYGRYCSFLAAPGLFYWGWAEYPGIGLTWAGSVIGCKVIGCFVFIIMSCSVERLGSVYSLYIGTFKKLRVLTFFIVSLLNSLNCIMIISSLNSVSIWTSCWLTSLSNL